MRGLALKIRLEVSMTHKLAGTPVQEQDIIDVQTLVDAYFDNAPDITCLLYTSRCV